MQKSLKNLLNLTRFNPITRNFPFPPLLSSFKYQFSNIIDPKNPLLLNQAFNNENKNEELKAQAVKALQETTQEEEQHFSLEDKTFTAKIGQHTLTYTIDEEIKGTKYGTGGFYVIMFTCEVCESKTVKSFSKQAYHEGVVMVRCEGCDKIHLMADNLGWFEDKPVNIEELMKRKNKKIIKVSENAEIANIFAKFMQNKNIIQK